MDLLFSNMFEGVISLSFWFGYPPPALANINEYKVDLANPFFQGRACCFSGPELDPYVRL